MQSDLCFYRQLGTWKKAEHWRIDAFELWFWRRLLRVPWTSRRSNQSILKEINLEKLLFSHFKRHCKWYDCRYQFSCSVVSDCDPMDCSTPGFPVHHQLPEFTQTHVYWVGDGIQPSHPLSSPSLPTFNLSQHQGLFQWVSSLHQVAKVLEFQLQYQSFQWIFRTDFL